MRVLFLVLITIGLTSSSDNLVKITIEQFDKVETKYISELIRKSLKNGMPTKEYSQELMNMAQKEAETLASLAKLENPSFNTTRKFYGFSRQIIGRIPHSNHLVGKIICFDNIVERKEKNLYDIETGCPVSERRSDGAQLGFGRALDTTGNLYHVRLFYLKN